MIDSFFDVLNVKNTLKGKVKKKTFQEPYTDPSDERFKVQFWHAAY